jgi:hypothetical protein
MRQIADRYAGVVKLNGARREAVSRLKYNTRAVYPQFALNPVFSRKKAVVAG